MLPLVIRVWTTNPLVTIVERTSVALAARTAAAGKRFAFVTVEPDHVALETLAEWVDAGRLRVHVEETFPLASAARAHERLGQGVTGKLVLTVQRGYRRLLMEFFTVSCFVFMMFDTAVQERFSCCICD